MTGTDEFLGFGPIWKESRLKATKARNDYFCQSTDCNEMIRKGDTYYYEFRGGLEGIRRCSRCFCNQEV